MHKSGMARVIPKGEVASPGTSHPGQLLSMQQSGEIAVLVYRCPTTHRQVTSAIQTTAKALARLGALKLSLWCPHCDDAHTVCARDAAVQPAGPGEAI